MPHEFISLDELCRQLGRDRKEVERLVQRGRIPGHRVESGWRFHPSEIRHWLEQEMRGYTPEELAAVEASQRGGDQLLEAPIAQLMPLEAVEVPLDARTRRSVLETLIEVAGRTWQVWEPAAILEAVLQREEVMSTAVPGGVAMPHPRNPLPQALGSSVVAFGRTLSGIAFGAPRRELTDLFFLVLCRDSRTHLTVLARLGRLLQLPGFLDELRGAADAASAHAQICRADRALGAA